MAVASTRLSLGTVAPDFDLPDYSGRRHRLSDFKQAKAIVVAFICHHCPYVKHIRSEFVRFVRDNRDKGLVVVAIAANDVESYPEDGPAGMQQEALEAGYDFPYLFDATQATAKAYQAACTPDIYLFDGQHKLFYRGRFDASSPKNNLPVTGADLRAAVDALLANRSAPAEQIPGIGCNIKWQPGNEPEYV